MHICPIGSPRYDHMAARYTLLVLRQPTTHLSREHTLKLRKPLMIFYVTKPSLSLHLSTFDRRTVTTPPHHFATPRFVPVTQSTVSLRVAACIHRGVSYPRGTFVTEPPSLASHSLHVFYSPLVTSAHSFPTSSSSSIFPACMTWIRRCA